jgi:hypothetical protein
MNPDQETNSVKAEGYFRISGNANESSIANALRSMRESIRQGDIKTYILNANVAESAYAKFTPAQKAAYEVWAAKNLKK